MEGGLLGVLFVLAVKQAEVAGECMQLAVDGRTAASLTVGASALAVGHHVRGLLSLFHRLVVREWRAA